MHGLDLISTSVLGALGCDMDIFLRYFPAAETMYSVFVALAIGIILLNWVWQLFRNFGLGAGIERGLTTDANRNGRTGSTRSHDRSDPRSTTGQSLVDIGDDGTL